MISGVGKLGEKRRGERVRERCMTVEREMRAVKRKGKKEKKERGKIGGGDGRPAG